MISYDSITVLRTRKPLQGAQRTENPNAFRHRNRTLSQRELRLLQNANWRSAAELSHPALP